MYYKVVLHHLLMFSLFVLLDGKINSERHAIDCSQVTFKKKKPMWNVHRHTNKTLTYKQTLYEGYIVSLLNLRCIRLRYTVLWYDEVE